MIFRLASYNIYKGAKNNFEQLTNAVYDLKADCIGLLESNGWEENKNKLLNIFSELTEFNFNFLAKANTDYNISLLSKNSPKNILKLNGGFHHTAILSIFPFDKKEIAVVFVHLNPKQEEFRVEEIKKIINFLEPYPYSLVMGDLNSLSPKGIYNKKQLSKLLRLAKITKFGVNNLRFDTINALESAGFVDIGAAKNNFQHTVPTALNTDINHVVPLRIDYAFASPNLYPYIKKFEIKKGELFDKVSDHYPLIVELDLP